MDHSAKPEKQPLSRLSGSISAGVVALMRKYEAVIADRSSGRSWSCQLGICSKRLPIALGVLLTSTITSAQNTETVTVADASITAAFYSDSSCLLTINSVVQVGKTVINADVDDVGSRMLIHCDTESGRRLTLLARGDSLNVSQRVPLLSREQVLEGEYGMIAWLTRTGVQFTDDNAPRRHVIGGSVILRKTPPVDAAGATIHTKRQSFARIIGVLEPILKPNSQIKLQPVVKEDPKPAETQNNTLEEAADGEDTAEWEDN